MRLSHFLLLDHVLSWPLEFQWEIAMVMDEDLKGFSLHTFVYFPLTHGHSVGSLIILKLANYYELS